MPDERFGSVVVSFRDGPLSITAGVISIVCAAAEQLAKSSPAGARKLDARPRPRPDKEMFLLVAPIHR